jgi:hypothetical protein
MLWFDERSPAAFLSSIEQDNAFLMQEVHAYPELLEVLQAERLAAFLHDVLVTEGALPNDNTTVSIELIDGCIDGSMTEVAFIDKCRSTG